MRSGCTIVLTNCLVAIGMLCVSPAQDVRSRDFGESPFPRAGMQLPELSLLDERGQVVSTASLKGSYTVLVFGCLTWPPFLRNVPSLETVAHDYMPRGVRFFYIYKALAHPGTNGYVTPYTLQERLMHVAEATARLGSRIPWLCDSMDNAAKHALGDRPNSEFIIDPDGRIVVARQWSRPSMLRQDLERLIGPVDRPTRVEDLHMTVPPPPERPARGVVRPIEIPGRMTPLIVRPADDSDRPYYVKLRVEQKGAQLYLGFFLDPLYHVHWNNQVPAPSFAIETPAGVSISPSTGQAARPDVDADLDPREFLVRIDGRSTDPIRVTLRYVACDDAQTFCKTMTQTFEIELKSDRDGGQRRMRGRDINPSARRGFDHPGQTSMGARAAEMLGRLPLYQTLDRNRDGVLSADEIAAAPQLLRRLDRNRDGTLSREELRPNIMRRLPR